MDGDGSPREQHLARALRSIAGWSVGSRG